MVLVCRHAQCVEKCVDHAGSWSCSKSVDRIPDVIQSQSEPLLISAAQGIPQKSIHVPQRKCLKVIPFVSGIYLAA